MSPSPHVTPAIALRLTKKSPRLPTGVGQKSSEVELIGSGRLTAAPQGLCLLARVAIQMSSPPLPPGRLLAMYSLRPSGDWIGHPSWLGVFRSGSFPLISSIFCAVFHDPKCGPAASAVPEAAPTTSATTSACLSTFIASPLR